MLDVIYGLQFAVDYKSTYNIRVVNLSLESTQAQSYKTDPLDAAVESAWLKGLVVVAAAGNRGTAGDAVDYAPGNDPYAISVGAVDDARHQGPRRRRAGRLVQPRHHPGRLRQARHLRPGRAHRVQPRPEQRVHADVPRRASSTAQYIRAGGTSMAAPVVAGAVADLLQARPELTPNQVKAIVLATDRTAQERRQRGLGDEHGALHRHSRPGQPGPQAQLAGERHHRRDRLHALVLEPRRAGPARRARCARAGRALPGAATAPRPATGSIDPTRSSWSRSSWSSTTDWKK